jgi:hypothetical protein
MRAAALLAAGLVLPPAAAAVADEVTDQLEQARRYYEQGDVTGAIGELEFTLQALRGRVGQELLATFPAPADGWTVTDSDGDGQAAIPFAAAGTMLGRTYRAAQGGGSVEAQLMSGGGFLQGLAGMLMSPQVLAAQPNARRVRIGRENAVVTYDPQARSAQLVLDLGGKATIMLQGENLADGEPLVDLASRWDLKRVRELLGA